MPQPGDPNPPRLSTENAFLELLTDTLELMEPPARGLFLEKFFRSIAHVDLNEAQSLDIWEQVLARKRELSENAGKNVALQVALVDVLASANLLRLPILMEYEDLRKLQINATTDPLTGLYNRRFFDDYFEKELNRSIRYSHRLALVVFDLQRFKQVNDLYGHPQGDVVLQMVATTLRKSMRTSDYAFRLGGDEFALLLPQSDTEQAATLSRRLRAAYAATIEPLRLGFPLALDYGFSAYPDDGELQDILFRVADQRLYEMKQATQSPAQASAAPAGARPAPTAEKQVPPPIGPVAQVCPTPEAEGPAPYRTGGRSNPDSRCKGPDPGAPEMGARFPGRYTRLCAYRRGSRTHGPSRGLGLWRGGPRDSTPGGTRGIVPRCTPRSDTAARS